MGWFFIFDILRVFYISNRETLIIWSEIMSESVVLSTKKWYRLLNSFIMDWIDNVK